MTTVQVSHLEPLAAIKPDELYPYQADDVAFLLSKPRTILSDDIGLGKTQQAIVALDIAVPDGANLVVCPVSLKLNWKREILLFYRLHRRPGGLLAEGGCCRRPLSRSAVCGNFKASATGQKYTASPTGVRGISNATARASNIGAIANMFSKSGRQRDD